MSECWGQRKDEGLGDGVTNRYWTQDLKSGWRWTCQGNGGKSSKIQEKMTLTNSCIFPFYQSSMTEGKYVQTYKISKILLPMNPFIEAIRRWDSPKWRDKNKRDEYTDPGTGVFNIRGNWNPQDGVWERAQIFTAQHTAWAISPDWSRSEDSTETTSKDKIYRLLDVFQQTKKQFIFLAWQFMLKSWWVHRTLSKGRKLNEKGKAHGCAVNNTGGGEGRSRFTVVSP